MGQSLVNETCRLAAAPQDCGRTADQRQPHQEVLMGSLPLTLEGESVCVSLTQRPRDRHTHENKTTNTDKHIDTHTLNTNVYTNVAEKQDVHKANIWKGKHTRKGAYTHKHGHTHAHTKHKKQNGKRHTRLIARRLPVQLLFTLPCVSASPLF